MIRPFKGLEHLVEAFEAIPESEIAGYWLTVVGETWEGWTLPAERIAASPRRDRITFVNRYVSDAELRATPRGRRRGCPAVPALVAQRPASCRHGLWLADHHE